MKIKRLHIENFRGIEDLDLELAAPVTVLVGENGAGKSSILDCMALLFSWYLARMRSPITGLGHHFGQTNIRLGKNLAQAALTVEVRNNETMQWSLTTAKEGYGAVRQLTENKIPPFGQLTENKIPPFGDSASKPSLGLGAVHCPPGEVFYFLGVALVAGDWKSFVCANAPTGVMVYTQISRKATGRACASAFTKTRANDCR